MADERYYTPLTGAQVDAALLDMAQHNSEAFAVGERAGTPVASSDPTYHNNSKYYAEQAEDSARRAESALPVDVNDAVLWNRAQSLQDSEKAQARANIGAGGSNENLLDNCDFQINQRGITSGQTITTGNYSFDRWKVTQGSIRVTINADGSKTFTNVGTGEARLSNIIDKNYMNLLVGERFCGSVNVKAYTGEVYFVLQEAGPPWQTLIPDFPLNRVGIITMTSFVLQTLSNNIQFFIMLKEGASITLPPTKCTKLEKSSVSTLANDAPPNDATELVKCLPYFERIGISNSSSLTDFVFVKAGATNINFNIPQTRKRATPVLAFSNLNQYRVLICNPTTFSSSTAISPTSIEGYNLNKWGGCAIRVALASAVLNDAYALLQRSDIATQAWIDISADL